jgi:PGF-CTERM protein
MSRSILAVALALITLLSLVAGAGVAGAQQSNSAAVTLSAQASGGHTVTVDSVTLPDGGFVTLHDASLNDGAVLASVVGSSSYLEAGTHENVTVRLDEPLSEDTTLVAMPHRDSNDNRIYEFVSANGAADGPYTADGSPVVDSAAVTASATVSASAQPTDGESVVVDRVELSAPGFVVVHDQTLLDEGDAVGSVAGVSDYLPAGVHENVRVELDSSVGSETVVPMAHRDTNGNEQYDFPDADGPFTADGSAVVDTAAMTVSDTSTVDFAAQASGGHTVTVDSVYVPDGGFVVMHDAALADGMAVESVVGASDYLAPGLHRNVVVTLDSPLDEGEQLTAMTHRDTNGNEAYEFPDADGPYTADGGAVVDGGMVSVSASVDMDAQSSDGRTVTVDRVDLSEGGFVTVHDSSLFAGAVEGSILGTSDYLEAGVHEDVQVTLDTPANESQVLVPMAHRDTNGNEAYDFPEADGPYTADGGAVVDTAPVSVSASVEISAQSGGETVVVDSVTLANGGFVTIHDGRIQDGAVFESVRGTSAYLGPGTHTDVEIALDTPYDETGTAVAMPHRDTNGNEAYDFVTSEGENDGPYTAGGAVVAAAEVTVDGTGMEGSSTETEMGEEMTETETTEEMTATETTEMDEEMTTTSTSTPGFGVVVAAGALLVAALVAARRR